MEYTIGEVSAILSLSRDMIRYYEKQGAIQAGRNEANRYRTYDTMEVFWLLEAMEHKSWGVPISEIRKIRGSQYAVNTAAFLDGEIAKKREEAAWDTLLAERLLGIRDYMEFGALNIGNFWVAGTEPAYLCHLVTGWGDRYERINLPEEASRFIFSEKMLPFFDSGFTARGGRIDWEMRISERYVRALKAELPEPFFRDPGGICLCTNVDIGEIGTFDPAVFHVLHEYAARRGYRVKEGAPVRGFLLGRGYEDGRFRRVIRAFLPLEEPADAGM
ncbi:MAG: MerR family transcriptional regulator [Lachnospiraceae bacterium]|nr:MerR family transcriptional regulator [Lachnospiraceae bacterium]